MRSNSGNIFHWAVSNVFRWSNLRAAFVGSMADRDRNEVFELYRRVTRAYESSPYSEEYGEIDFVQDVVQEASRRAGRVPSLALQAAHA